MNSDAVTMVNPLLIWLPVVVIIGVVILIISTKRRNRRERMAGTDKQKSEARANDGPDQRFSE